MKGSMKVKFDLGWVFSATLAVGLVVFGAARLSLAMEAQNSLQVSCQLYEVEMKDTYALIDKPFTEGLFYSQCINEFKRPTINIVLDTDKWSYGEIYSDAIERLKSLNP